MIFSSVMNYALMATNYVFTCKRREKEAFRWVFLWRFAYDRRFLLQITNESVKSEFDSSLSRLVKF